MGIVTPPGGYVGQSQAPPSRTGEGVAVVSKVYITNTLNSFIFQFIFLHLKQNLTSFDPFRYCKTSVKQNDTKSTSWNWSIELLISTTLTLDYVISVWEDRIFNIQHQNFGKRKRELRELFGFNMLLTTETVYSAFNGSLKIVWQVNAILAMGITMPNAAKEH